MGRVVNMVVPIWMVAVTVAMMGAWFVVVAVIVWFRDSVICISHVTCVEIIHFI